MLLVVTWAQRLPVTKTVITSRHNNLLSICVLFGATKKGIKGKLFIKQILTLVFCFQTAAAGHMLRSGPRIHRWRWVMPPFVANFAENSFMLHKIESAIEDIKAGKLVIVVDDED